MLVVTLLFLLLIIISYFCYRKVFYYPPSVRTDPDAPLPGKQYKVFEEDIRHISRIMTSVPCEEITILSFDGTALFGRFYAVQEGAPIQILFHGYQSCAFRDCSGGHALCRKMGFNALVVDQRAHGNSAGNNISFGINERRDCLCWINYVDQRFGPKVPVILSGVSMGAATILMSADLLLPDCVACIIADSPYSSPAAIIQKVCQDRHYPPFLTMPFIHLGAFLFGRFRLSESSAVSAVAKTKIPILLIHGEADRFVPCDMSLEIAAACRSKVTVETFPNAGHGLSYLVDPLRYEQCVLRFLQHIPDVAKHIDPVFSKKYQDSL